jgi:ketosteroid isomerase-like protein
LEKETEEILEIVDRETRAWDTQDVNLLLTIFHPDMVWPWPPTNQNHNPEEWILEFGHFDRIRWGESWRELFETYQLEHNLRKIKKIEVSKEKDAAFAVVDIDTLWINKKSGIKNHWIGCVCKVYTKTGDEWKLIMHTGALDYSHNNETSI